MASLKPYRAQLVVGTAENDIAEAGQIFNGLLEEAKRRGLHVEGFAFGEMPTEAIEPGSPLAREIQASNDSLDPGPREGGRLVPPSTQEGAGRDSRGAGSVVAGGVR